jgi:hypothetical protein
MAAAVSRIIEIFVQTVPLPLTLPDTLCINCREADTVCIDRSEKLHMDGADPPC